MTFAATNPALKLPPTQHELPCDDGEPIETERHKVQLQLLTDALIPWLEARADGYVGGNMFVYYSMAQVKNRAFKGPDFFAVVDVPKGERQSWVSWEEGKTPDVVIELLSESTADTDKGHKKLIYQNQMHVSEYFWYDPFNSEDWAGFRLQGGTYKEIPLDPAGQFISQVMQLALVRWQGMYKGIETTWLRWAQLEGTVLSTPDEQIEHERQRTEQQRQRAEQESRRAEQESQRAEQAEAQVVQIVQNLLQTGLEITQVSEITGLAVAQVEALVKNYDS